jgi:hypothetical protein
LATSKKQLDEHVTNNNERTAAAVRATVRGVKSWVRADQRRIALSDEIARPAA